MNYHRY